ncbi:flagellar motor protein MotB [Aestuariivirga sp.]|uniref:flagellar motor protein MotB n=1 Tax=Aestuariivirga sp. TaxID=2650926 RepID=UPI0039E5A867
MTAQHAPANSEIVIIRRRGGDDAAAHKGGAWKIAYADFVTAMMAFFLVMWLINASNEATRAQVASYFNPIKLMDSSTAGRGLNDANDVKKKEARGTGASDAEKAAEQKLMADPVKALEDIAKPAVVAAKILPETHAAESGGMADPFDPASQPALPPAPPAAKVPDKPAAIVQRQGAPSKPAPVPPPQDAEESRRQAMAAAIKSDLAKALTPEGGALPAGITVEPVKEGVLISLTEAESFSMFEVGSAKPNLQLVKTVEAIAETLENRPGYVVIRGHTDARPYHNAAYDNWQLSTDRAHMAHYMLVRAGLDEKRIRRIEGLADRQPKIADDPQAPENRRIDILLGPDP